MINLNSKKIIEEVMIPLYDKILQNKEVNGTVELIGKSIILDPAQSELAYGELRPFNHKYAKQEEDWYESLDRCIKGHEGIENNKTWSSIASKNGMVNSNYGYLVYAKRTGGESQYNFALESLIDSYKDGNSGRQSVIYYAGPDMHLIWNDNINAKHDFTCTFNTQHFIRDNKLIYIVNQRSADLIFGVTYDFHHHCRVYQSLIKDLKNNGIDIENGYIQMNFGSLHVYERHFNLIKNIVETLVNNLEG